MESKNLYIVLFIKRKRPRSFIRIQRGRLSGLIDEGQKWSRDCDYDCAVGERSLTCETGSGSEGSESGNADAGGEEAGENWQ